jgi:valyl-tRNA synthetase
MTLPDGRTVNTSPKFDVGRNFCNKLWNASRFAMMNLEGMDTDAFDADKLHVTDQWILSRLAQTIDQVTESLDAFKYSEPLNQLYRFFWNDLCDWYLEWAKPRMQDLDDKPQAQNVLAFVLDQTLRMLHPILPFITEGIFGHLNQLTPTRGLKGLADCPASDALVVAKWPERLECLINRDVEAKITTVQQTTRAIREIRNERNIAPGKKLTVSARAPQEIADVLNASAALVQDMANLDGFTAGPDLAKPANAAVAVAGTIEVYVHDAVDPGAERDKLVKQKEQLEKFLKGVQGKLANENFVSRAKPEVVEQSRAKEVELKEQLAAVEKHLAELG